MEYFQGMQLFDMITDRVEKHGTFNEAEVAKIIQTILEAVSYCHSHNVMHKDIKPKKILVNEKGLIKIVDFGLSKWEFLSKLQMMAGTPYYLAPEVLKGIRNAKSDIWSIGVIMFALLSGHLPFVSDANETVFHKAIKGDYSFEHSVWDSVTEEAKDLITRMINVDLAKRYTAAESMQHEWFQKVTNEDTNQDLSMSLIENLKLIRSKTIMQNVAHQFVKHALENNELQEMHREFDDVADEKGQVNVYDFKKVVSKFSPEFSSDQVEKLVKDVLKTQRTSGKINYMDLLDELQSMHDYNEDTKIWMTYNKFANDDTGFISFNKLKPALLEF
jgi:calcium-dependent protein kinase